MVELTQLLNLNFSNHGHETHQESVRRQRLVTGFSIRALEKYMYIGICIKFFISARVHSMPICKKLDFLCMATTGTLAEVQTLNLIFDGYKSSKSHDTTVISRSMFERSLSVD